MVDLISKIEATLRGTATKGTAGIWLDESEFVEAAAKTRAAGFTKFEALSPYPVHGIDEAMEIPRSYIPYITFAAGAVGCLFGIWFTWWTSVANWPLVIGGKPLWSLAAFIPVIFECTVLFAALTSVGAMIVINGLPKVDPRVIDPDLTSHKFALFIPENDSGYDPSKVEQHLRSLGAVDVRRTEF